MTVEEIFSQVAQHMTEGLMFHSQMTDYFEFLGMEGFKACHEYRFFDESTNYRRIVNYFMSHYNKLLVDLPFKNPGIIPEGWLKYNKFNVDTQTRKVGIQSGFERWVEWEKETKAILENFYKQFIEIGEVASAIELKEYIKDVDIELAEAQKEHLHLKAIDYDMVEITSMQHEIHQKYKKKMKELKV